MNTTARQIPDWKILKNFRISSESEDILDFSELIKLRLKNDTVDSIDTKWGDILSVMRDKPTDQLLKDCEGCSLEKVKQMQ